MQLRSETKVIDGTTFITTELPVMRGLVLGARLGKIITPMLSQLRGVDRPKMLAAVNAFRGDAKDMDLAALGDIFEALGPAASEAFTKIEPIIDQLARDMLVSTTAIVDGVKVELNSDVAINAAFGGQLWTILKVLWWVGMVNFKKKLNAAPVVATSAPAKGSP